MVLLEDKLQYYKSRKDKRPIGELSLPGGFVFNVCDEREDGDLDCTFWIASTGDNKVEIIISTITIAIAMLLRAAAIMRSSLCMWVGALSILVLQPPLYSNHRPRSCTAPSKIPMSSRSGSIWGRIYAIARFACHDQFVLSHH